MIKVKMKQHYIDARLHLYPDQECEVDAQLASFLLGHRMAEKVEPVAVAESAQPEPEAEPKPRARRTRKHEKSNDQHND